MTTTPSSPKDPRWYRDGLCFNCTACGDCCRDHGEYTYVYVSDADLTALAAELGQSEQEVEQQFCDHEDGWRFLKRASGACVFLTEKGLCGVYKARPKQCGTWPYWEDNIATEKKWVDAVKSFCPGIGKGEVTPADDVQRIARETEEWYEG